MAIKSNLVIPSVVAMYGENGGNKLEKRIIIKTDSIPEASSATFGKFYCYSGETNSTYHHGYIYECLEDETGYYYERIDVQPGVKADDFNTPLSPTNKGASMADLEDVKTSDLTFKGYISTTEPSSSTYNLVTGNMWYSSSTLPTTLPIPASSLKIWDGSAWQNATDSYMPDDLDAWKDLNDGETYVYFAGEWQDYAPQLSPNYFYLNTSTGKWEINSDVNLPGYPTVSNPPTTDLGIATKAYVDAIAGDFKRGLYDNGTNVATSSSTVISLVNTVTVYTIKPTENTTLSFSTTNLDIPTNAMTTFYLIIDFSDGIYNITWPNIVQWGNITPTMTANVFYMFSFTKPYNANLWIGNQMYSWEVN